MRSRALAATLGLLTVVAAVGALGCVRALDWSFREAVDAFVVSNILIGVSFGLCGALIAWHKPGSSLGWMYAAGGMLQTLTALSSGVGQLLHDHGAATWLVRLDLTVFQWGWPVNIAL